MRIIVMGQQAFGKAALEAILEADKDEVVAVYTAPDKEGRPVDPLKEAALDHSLPLYQPVNFKDQEVLDQMGEGIADNYEQALRRLADLAGKAARGS